MELAGELERIRDIELDALLRQHAGIADLATGFGVERGTVQDDHCLVAGLHRRHRPALLQQRHDLQAAGIQLVVPQEHGRRKLGHQIGRQARGGGELAGIAGATLLLLHGGIEAGHVHRQPALARDVGGQVDREAVGVVEPERIGTRDHAIGHARGNVVEDAHARIQRLGEALFLGLECTLDQFAGSRQFRIGIAHQLGQRTDHLVEEGLAHAQHPAMAQRATDDTAQHIAPALVGRQDAIDDQEATGADVVRDHAQRLVLEVGRTGQLRSLADQALEQVDLVVGVDMLQDRGQTLQPHASVDARRRQRHQRTVGLAIELHEDVVPDLDVAIAVLIGRTGWTASDMVTVVVEDLRARAAGTGVGHLPEIVRGVRGALVVADADDPLGRQADHLVPQVVGLVVGVIDGNQEPFRCQSPHVRQQLPRPSDGLLLEIVAEGPVAQHFEEGMVARGITDRIEVVVLAARTQAALHVGRTHVAALFRTQEHILELHHAGVGEQQRGIVAGHQ